MSTRLHGFGLAICCALLASEGTTANDAETILQTIRSEWQLPTLDQNKRHDPVELRAHENRIREALNRRVDLIGKFYQLAPGHPMARELMLKRWAAMIGRKLESRREELRAEVERIASERTNPLRVEAAYFRAVLGLGEARNSGPEAALRPIEAFIAVAPKDERGASLLSYFTSLSTISPETKSSVLTRLMTEYPDSAPAQSLQASERRSEKIGKPLEFTFTDAINGRIIGLQKDLKGKVVVIDFWSTGCGPCVAEMPRLKALYNQYKGMGVEFIGVSLDESSEEGRKAVRDFVQKHRIEWLQSHGKDAEAFVNAWGILRIPTVFVVDTKGNLHTAEGRGKLDSLIPELLR